MGAGQIAAQLHDESYVIDLVSPLISERPSTAAEYLAGGATAVGATVLPYHGGTLAEGCLAVQAIRSQIRGDDRLVLVEGLNDIRDARSSGQLGVILHFQSSTFLERSLDAVWLFHDLGLRVAQLTYNVRNFIADGCVEPADAGLSRFGREVIAEMNQSGIVVDLSHCGRASSLQAIETSQRPVIFSHSGAGAVFPHKRNIDDEQIVRCAERGGVIGIPGLPYFIGERPPVIEHLVHHARHVADLVGPEHVGLGMDYFTGVIPYSTVEEQIAENETESTRQLWSPDDFPPPPYAYAPGIETPAGLPAVTEALLDGGFTCAEVRGILGENFMRVFDATWKS
jgi:membrane dipeptidase